MGVLVVWVRSGSFGMQDKLSKTLRPSTEPPLKEPLQFKEPFKTVALKKERFWKGIGRELKASSAGVQDAKRLQDLRALL